MRTDFFRMPVSLFTQMLFTVPAGRHAMVQSKRGYKIASVPETRYFRNFLYGLVCIRQQFSRPFHSLLLQVGKKATPIHLLEACF